MALQLHQMEDIPVVRVISESGVKGSSHAFDKLESKMPTMKGRKMYGVYYPLKDEYSACVFIDPAHPDEMGFERWTIPGGLYAKARLDNWMANLDKIHVIMKGLEQESLAQGYACDPNRPSIEFYRTSKELICLFPVIRSDAPKA